MKVLAFLAFIFSLSSCVGSSKTSESQPAVPPIEQITAIAPGSFDLVEFHVYDDPSGVRLYWATEREINSLKFHVERSSNGNSWEEIGTLSAGGTTSERTPYRFLDETPFSGNNFYRIILEDIEGTTSISEVQSIKHYGFFNLSMFPNPAQFGQPITINFEGEEHHEFQVELIEKSGARIQRESFESDWGNNQLTFVPKAPTRGKYFIRIYLDDYPVQAFTLQLK